MAFAGFHAVAGYAGVRGLGHSVQPLIRKITDAQTMSVAGTSTISAPAHNDFYGAPIFRLRTSADAWVSVAAAPDASAGKRFLLPANTDYDVGCEPGDKLAWILA